MTDSIPPKPVAHPRPWKTVFDNGCCYLRDANSEDFAKFLDEQTASEVVSAINAQPPPVAEPLPREVEGPVKLCCIPSHNVGKCDLEWGHDGYIHSNSGDGFHAANYFFEHRERQRIRSRKCGFCGRPHPVSDKVAEESPNCAACLHDRVARKLAAIPPLDKTPAPAGGSADDAHGDTAYLAPSGSGSENSAQPSAGSPVIPPLDGAGPREPSDDQLDAIYTEACRVPIGMFGWREFRSAAGRRALFQAGQAQAAEQIVGLRIGLRAAESRAAQSEGELQSIRTFADECMATLTAERDSALSRVAELDGEARDLALEMNDEAAGRHRAERLAGELSDRLDAERLQHDETRGYRQHAEQRVVGLERSLFECSCKVASLERELDGVRAVVEAAEAFRAWSPAPELLASKQLQAICAAVDRRSASSTAEGKDP